MEGPMARHPRVVGRVGSRCGRHLPQAFRLRGGEQKGTVPAESVAREGVGIPKNLDARVRGHDVFLWFLHSLAPIANDSVRRRKPFGHQSDHGNMNHGLAAGREQLVVFA